MTERKQWERQENETPKAFDAFCAYRDLPTAERSLQKAWSKYKERTGNKSGTMPGRFRDWSSANKWVDRVGAYDDYKDAQHREAYEVERLKQRDNRQQVVRALQGMTAKVMQTQQQVSMTPAELNALANAVSKVLNESRIEFDDLPTQRVKNELTGADGGAIKHRIVLGWDDGSDGNYNES